MKKFLVFALALTVASGAWAGTAYYGGAGGPFEAGTFSSRGTPSGVSNSGGNGLIVKRDGATTGIFTLDGTELTLTNTLLVPDTDDYVASWKFTSNDDLRPTNFRRLRLGMFAHDTDKNASNGVTPLDMTQGNGGQEGNKMYIRIDADIEGSTKLNPKNASYVALDLTPFGGANVIDLANPQSIAIKAAAGAGAFVTQSLLESAIIEYVIVKDNATPKRTETIIIDGEVNPLVEFPAGLMNFSFPNFKAPDSSGPDFFGMEYGGIVAPDGLIFQVTGDSVPDVNADLVGQNVPSMTAPFFN